MHNDHLQPFRQDHQLALTDEPVDPVDRFLSGLAQVADVCLKPHRHALRFSGSAPATIGDCSDCALLVEARTPTGEREPAHDLELEIYRSGRELNLMLSRAGDAFSPILWHGQHPVWMQASDGHRCERPSDGAPLEAFCRRVRALLGAS